MHNTALRDTGTETQGRRHTDRDRENDTEQTGERDTQIETAETKAETEIKREAHGARETVGMGRGLGWDGAGYSR